MAVSKMRLPSKPLWVTMPIRPTWLEVLPVGAHRFFGEDVAFGKRRAFVPRSRLYTRFM